jgi:CO/xanthine dehydrogenase FAD-binding subunit
MISFDFDYYKPDSIKEAVNVYKDLNGQGKIVIYYAGGTEIISRARLNQINFDAAIDIKGIPECNQFGFQNDKLVIGAAVTLTKISDSGFFPLLGASCRRSADHTARDKITLGGNICGRTPYKEAILPLLLSDSEVVIAGVNGVKSLLVTQAFNRELQLNNGEFLVQITIDKSYTVLPYASVKKTKQEKVDYPLVTVALVEKDKRIKVAFSGLCSFPFCLPVIEDDLNNGSAPIEVRVNNIINHLPAPILNDMLGSAEYREFAARNVLSEAFEKLGGVK